MKKLLFISSLALSINANAQWTTVNNGLADHDVRSIVVKDTTLFAAAAGGVFKSSNNGALWSTASTGLPNSGGGSYTLIVRDSFLFVGHDASSAGGGAVWRSVNNGANWTYASSGALYTNIVRALAVQGTVLYAGTNSGGVHRSYNNGTTWTVVNTGLTNLNIRAIAVKGDTVYAGTDGGSGVYASVDSGATWSGMSTGLTNTLIRSMNVQGANIYVGTYMGDVFKSTDGGANWNPVNTGLPASATCYALASNSSIIFAGIDAGGPFFSTDNGNNWTTCGTGIPSSPQVNYPQTLVIKGTNVFAGTYSAGIFTQPTLNFATSIKEPITNIINFAIYPNPASSILNVECLMANGTNQLTMYDMLGNSIYHSTFTTQHNTIDVSDLAAGIYNISISSNEGVINKRVIINK